MQLVHVDPATATIEHGRDRYVYTGPGGVWGGVWDWTRDDGAPIQIPTRRVAWHVGVEAVTLAVDGIELGERAALKAGLRADPPPVERPYRGWVMIGDVHVCVRGFEWTCSTGPGDGRECSREEAVEALAFAMWRPMDETRAAAVERARALVAEVAP